MMVPTISMMMCQKQTLSHTRHLLTPEIFKSDWQRH